MNSDGGGPGSKGPNFPFSGGAFPTVRLATPATTRKTTKEAPKKAEGGTPPAKSRSGKTVASSSAQTVDARQALTKAESDLARLLKQDSELKARLRELQTRYDSLVLNQDTASLTVRIEQAEKNLSTLWAAKKNAELAVVDSRAVIKESEAEVARTCASAPYQLGQLVLESWKDWRSLLALPRKIIELRKRFQVLDEQERIALLPSYGINAFAVPLEFSLNLAAEKGFAAAREWVLTQQLRAPVLSRVLVELAKAARGSDAPMAVTLARDALAADPSENRIKSLGFMLMDAGNLTEARDVLAAAVAAGVVLNATEERRRQELLALERLATTGIRCPDRAELPFSRGETPVVAVFTAQTFPFHWSAASMRAHGAALSVKRFGAKAHVISPPNYPPPRSDGKEHKSAVPIDGVAYHRLRSTSTEVADIDQFARQTAIFLADMLRHVGAEVLIAPSDLMLGYSALIATRLAGVSLVIDSIGPDVGGMERERELLFRSLEDAIMLHADHVLAHSTAEADRLRRVGVPSEKIEQLPEFVPMFEMADTTDWRAHPHLKGRFILGYMGEQAEDVDIEALAEILGTLVAQGRDVGLFVVGVGTRFNKLGERLAELGLAERSLISGRPRNGMLRGLYDSVDLFLTPIRAGARNTRWRRFEHAVALAYGRPVLGEGPGDATAPWPGSEIVPNRESLVIRAGELAENGPAYAELKQAAQGYAEAGDEKSSGGATTMRRIMDRP